MNLDIATPRLRTCVPKAPRRPVLGWGLSSSLEPPSR